MNGMYAWIKPYNQITKRKLNIIQYVEAANRAHNSRLLDPDPTVYIVDE